MSDLSKPKYSKSANYFIEKEHECITLTLVRKNSFTDLYKSLRCLTVQIPINLFLRFYMKKILYATVILLVFTGTAFAQSQSFDSWLSGFKAKALARGISQGTINNAFANVSPIQRVIELDRKQPEGKMTFAQYKNRVISNDRIAQGRRLLLQYMPLLKQIEAKYGVAPQYVVALWGIETSYGNNTGGFDIVPALATLAWEGRRRSFFEDELMTALRILDEGHISQSRFKGSWAGAMGQNQFMPSSFMRLAVDYNGDGRKDIWTSLPDVFASSSNYLAKSGWKSGERWGREVKVPSSFTPSMFSKGVKKSVTEWGRLGVTSAWGHPLPQETVMGYLVQPDGATGSTYLVYNNFDIIKKWNNSTYFATSVGLIADAISQ